MTDTSPSGGRENRPVHVCIEWSDADGQLGALNRGQDLVGHLSVFGKPSMTRTDGVVAIGIDVDHITDVLVAAHRLQWNALEGGDEHSPLVVSAESFHQLRRALRRMGGIRDA